MEAPGPPSTLPALLAKVVAARGEHEAVITAARSADLRRAGSAVGQDGAGSVAIGAGKGTRISLMAPDGILWLTVFLAGLRIGALVTTISTLCTAPELAHILRNSDAQIFIGTRRFLRHEYGHTLMTALPGLNEAKAEALRLPAAPYLRSIWLDDASDLDWARSIENSLGGRTLPTRRMQHCSPPSNRRSRRAMRQWSSTPRGARRNRRPLCIASGRSRVIRQSSPGISYSGAAIG